MDELRLAQIRLGQALDGARGGDQRLAEIVREEGLRFVQVLTSLLRLTRLHHLQNHAFDGPVREFRICIDRLWQELGAVHVVAVEDQIYVNDIRMRLTANEEKRDLATLLREHNVGGLSFHSTMDERAIRSLVGCFAARPEPGRRRTALLLRMRAAGLDGIDASGVFLFKVGADADPDQSTVQMMERATEAAAEAWDAVANHRIPNPLPMRRSVTEMLAEGLNAEGLWEEDKRRLRPGRHSVRVARLALLLGQELGLSAAALQDLGVAAIFHDIGYAANQPNESHETAGARLLLRQRGFHEAKIQRIRATLEHHRNHDHSGGRPGLFSRILRIVEDYDNLARSKQASFSPALALQLMVSESGSFYDPLLLQLLVNRLGCYPPGTLLRLEDGRIVRSRSLVRDPDIFDRPECFLVVDEHGNRPEIGAIIDLAYEGEIVGLAHPGSAS